MRKGLKQDADQPSPKFACPSETAAVPSAHLGLLEGRALSRPKLWDDMEVVPPATNSD